MLSILNNFTLRRLVSFKVFPPEITTTTTKASDSVENEPLKKIKLKRKSSNPTSTLII